MNILKEIVYGKEGVAEREHKALHPEEHEVQSKLQEIKPVVVPLHRKEENLRLEKIHQDTSESTNEKLGKKDIVTEPKKIHEGEIESATEALKKMEIRSGIQTVESTKDPESMVALSKEAVLQETLKPMERIEIQPVIHRQREQMEVHQINENISQTEVLPTVYKEKELPARYVGEFIEDDQAVTEKYLEANAEIKSTMEVEGVRRIRIVKEPVVEEHVHKTIVEVVQPIIHKETFAPVVIKETLPLYEKVIEAPTMSMEERSVDLGVTVDQQLKNTQLKQITEEKSLQKDSIFLKEGTLESKKEKLP